MSDSFTRRRKRQAMKDNAMTFSDRVREAVRTGKPVKEVTFAEEGK